MQLVPLRTGTTKYEDAKELHWFEAFYRTGSIIFGGGQVVLPLLLKDVVGPLYKFNSPDP
jgi:hypothetical protein